MKKIVIMLLMILTASISFAAVSNQDNRIDVNELIKDINNFNKYDFNSEGVSARKNILHEIQIYGTGKDSSMGRNERAFLFYMIKTRIGEENFKKGMDNLKDIANSPDVTWLQILRCFPDLNADAFYDAYFLKSPMIEIIIKEPKYIIEKGEFYILFSMTRLNGDDYVNIPYMLDYSDRKEYGRLQTGLNKEEVFKVPVKSGAVKLLIDPYYTVLRKLAKEESTPVIANILTAEDIVFVSDKDDVDVHGVFKNIKLFINNESLQFSDVKNSNLIINGYDNFIAKFFTDKQISNSSNSDYFVFENPQGQDKYILIMNNYKLENIQALKNYSMNQELVFKDSKLIKKYNSDSSNGIFVLEKKDDIAVNTTLAGTIDTLIPSALNHDLIFISEHHDNYAHHLNQLEIIQKLNNSSKKLAVALEMVPAKYQNVLNDFIAGKITEKEMLQNIDYYGNWGFDYSLYAPIFKYARDNGIELVALNISDNVTNKAYRDNMTSLTDEEKAELPETMNLLNKKYERELKNIFKNHNINNGVFSNFYLAQNIWDEAMAHNLVKYADKNLDKRIVVLCGSGHAGKDTGIPLRYKRITGKSSFVIMQDEQINPLKADYVITTNYVESNGTPKIGIYMSDKEEDADKVRISKIDENSPASEAGLKEGDVFLKCGYHDIKNIGSLRYALFEKGYNSSIECTILRGKNKISKVIKLFEYEKSKNKSEKK